MFKKSHYNRNENIHIKFFVYVEYVELIKDAWANNVVYGSYGEKCN